MDSKNIVIVNSDGSIAKAFPGTGFDVTPNDLIIYGNYALVIGNFTSYNGSPAPYLAKINLNTGELDPSFDTGTSFNISPQCFSLLGDSLYLGGNFTSYNSISIERIAKISAVDGSLDPTFSQSTGFNNVPFSILATSEGIFAAGSFSTYRSVSAYRIAKLNATTGNLDVTFDTGLGFSSTVMSLAYEPGAIYASGYFSSYNSLTATRLAKINSATGALISAFDTTTGLNGAATHMKISGNNLILTGSISSYKTSNIYSLAVVNKTDASFNSSLTSNLTLYSDVKDIYADSEKIIFVGSFKYSGGTPVGNFLRLNSNFEFDSTFTNVLYFDQPVRDFEIFNNQLYVVGDFQNISSSSAPYFAKIDPGTAAIDTGFSTTAAVSTPKYYISANSTDLFIHTGSFGESTQKYNPSTGAKDSGFNPSSIFNNVYDLLATDNGVYAANSESTMQRYNVTNGSNISAFVAGGGVSATSIGLAYDSPWIYALSNRDTYRSLTAQRVVKINELDGTLDSTFDTTTGFSGVTTNGKMALSEDKTYLYISSGQTVPITYKGTSIYNLIKISATDASLQTSFNHYQKFNGRIYQIVEKNGKLFVTGDFIDVDGEPYSYLRVLNANDGL
ncbi:MAG: delta-60 repeat domain-containing protein [Bdellovibrionales bacterium]|nr:delta-60 repeat domain-containing protein [Bdellovibrionales bacterium]